MAENEKPKNPRREVEFARPRLDGPRFEGHAIPVELLSELEKYRKLLLEVAKDLYRLNTGGEEPPAGFSKRFKLELKGVEEGSAIPVFVRELPPIPEAVMAAAQPPAETDTEEDFREFDEARDLVAQTIEMVAAKAEIPDRFPRRLLPMLENLGKKFEHEGSFEFRGPSAPREQRGPQLTPGVRERIHDIRSKDYSRQVVHDGTVTGFDWGGWFKIQTLDFRVIEGKHVGWDIQRVLLAGLTSKGRARVRIDAHTTFSPSGLAKQITEVVSAALWTRSDGETLGQLEERIASLAAIEEGWLEGAGERLDAKGLDWLKSWLIREMVERGLPKPRLFPTPDGEIEAEWSAGPWEITATFNLEKHTAYLHAAQTETLEDDDQTVNLRKGPGEDDLFEFLKRFGVKFREAK
jgi:hypothetical protein